MTDADDGLLAGSAAIVATYYGRRDSAAMQDLHLQLYRSLADDPNASTVPANPWWSSDGSSGLLQSDPGSMAAHDASVVQVTLSEPGGSGATGDRLASISRRFSELAGDAVPPGIWGRTLVYQAALDGDEHAEPALEAGLRHLRTAPPLRALHSLGHADVAGGRIWLLAVPVADDPSATSTVYVALVPAAQEKAFGPGALWGSGAWLLLPDLIATKGYFDRRAHLGLDSEGRSRDDLFRARLDALRSMTDHILGKVGNQSARVDAIDALARAYGPVATALAQLRQLQTNVLDQVHNFNAEHLRLGDSILLQFHQRHLDAAAFELERKITDGEAALSGARDASGLAQIQVAREQIRLDRAQQERQHQLDQKQDERRHRIALVVAAITAAFAVPQVFDRRAAWETLRLVGYEHPSIWRQMLVQVAAILIVAAVLAGLVTLITYLLNRE